MCVINLDQYIGSELLQDQGRWTGKPKMKVKRDIPQLPAELLQLVNVSSYIDGSQMPDDVSQQEEEAGNQLREKQRQIKAAHKQDMASAKVVMFKTSCSVLAF